MRDFQMMINCQNNYLMQEKKLMKNCGECRYKNFDKLMNSKNADMQNINYVGGAGSTTAAQFLQQFYIK